MISIETENLSTQLIEIINLNTQLIEIINAFQMTFETLPRAEYIPVRNRLFRAFEEMVSTHETEYPEEREEIARIRHNLSGYLHEIIERADEIYRSTMRSMMGSTASATTTMVTTTTTFEEPEMSTSTTVLKDDEREETIVEDIIDEIYEPTARPSMVTTTDAIMTTSEYELTTMTTSATTLSFNGQNLRRRNAELKTMNLRGANFSGMVDETDVHLEDLDLKGAIFDGVNLAQCRLNNADLRGADLRKANLHYKALRQSDFRSNPSKHLHYMMKGRNLCGIIIDQTTKLNPEQVDYLIELHNRGLEINGLDTYLAYYRHIDEVELTEEMSATTVHDESIVANMVNEICEPLAVSSIDAIDSEEEFCTPNASPRSSFSESLVDSDCAKSKIRE